MNTLLRPCVESTTLVELSREEILDVIAGDFHDKPFRSLTPNSYASAFDRKQIVSMSEVILATGQWEPIQLMELTGKYGTGLLAFDGHHRTFAMILADVFPIVAEIHHPRPTPWGHDYPTMDDYYAR